MGDIIFIGSEAGLLGVNRVFVAAKFGLKGFSKPSKDVANNNIR